MDVGIRAANWLVAFDIAGNTGWQPDEPFRRLLVNSLSTITAATLYRIWNGRRAVAAITICRILSGCCLSQRICRRLAKHNHGSLLRPASLLRRPNGSFTRTAATTKVRPATIASLANWLYSDVRWSPDWRARATLPLKRLTPATLERGLPVPSAPLAQFETGVRSPVSPAAVARLAGIGRFVRAVLRPDNNIVQVGDRDSGRRKLHPVWGAEDEEDLIDHRHLIAAADALFDRPIHGPRWLDAQVVRSLMKEQAFSEPWRPVKPSVGGQSEFQTAINRLASLPPMQNGNCQSHWPNCPRSERSNRFDFGLHVIKGKISFWRCDALRIIASMHRQAICMMTISRSSCSRMVDR